MWRIHFLFEQMLYLAWHSLQFFPPLLQGYVQGMSDLLSPILVVMENEVEAFWCFVGFMEKLVGHNKSNLNLAVYFIYLFIACIYLLLRFRRIILMRIKKE